MHLRAILTQRLLVRLSEWAVVLSVGGWALTACQGSQPATEQPPSEAPLISTPDEVFSLTLQASAAGTAVWVGRLTPAPTATDEILPTAGTPAMTGGTPLAQRIGDCPQPEGYMLHVRQGFCLAAPSTWTSYNVDGGMAASLDTTPGQALSLVPDWAESAEVCNLMIYITAERSALDHLNAQFATFADRADLVQMSPSVQMQVLGEVTLPGFTWISSNGQSGGIFADRVGINRVAHISFSGSQCAVDGLLPILNTLRFNMEQ